MRCDQCLRELILPDAVFSEHFEDECLELVSHGAFQQPVLFQDDASADEQMQLAHARAQMRPRASASLPVSLA